MPSGQEIAAGGAPWYRVVAIPDAAHGGTPDRDYAAVLPAALDAARRQQPLVVGWFSRGGGGPLPSAPEGAGGPGPAGADAGGQCELLFPWGARGVPLTDSLLADLDRLVWAPCPGRLAPPGEAEAARGPAWPSAGLGVASLGAGLRMTAAAGLGGASPSLFESALTTLMARPFGWLVVAEPTDAIGAEIAELRTRLNAVRRFDEERSRLEADRAIRRLAELDAFREAGLWNVRVLVGAGDAGQLAAIGP